MYPDLLLEGAKNTVQTYSLSKPCIRSSKSMIFRLVYNVSFTILSVLQFPFQFLFSNPCFLKLPPRKMAACIILKGLLMLVLVDYLLTLK